MLQKTALPKTNTCEQRKKSTKFEEQNENEQFVNLLIAVYRKLTLISPGLI